MTGFIQVAVLCSIITGWIVLISVSLLLVLYRRPEKALIAASFAIPTMALLLLLLLIGVLPNLTSFWIMALLSGPLVFLIVQFWLSLTLSFSGKTWDEYIGSIMKYPRVK